jgi:hypothetical protein
MPRFTIVPEIETMLMVVPRRRGAITGPSAWLERKTPVALIS